MLAQRAANHRRVPVGDSQVDKVQLQCAQVFDQEIGGLANLEHAGAVIDVDSGGAEMKIIGCVGIQSPSPHIEECDHAMPDNLVLSTDFRLGD